MRGEDGKKREKRRALGARRDAGACDEDQTDSGWHGNGNDLPSCS